MAGTGFPQNHAECTKKVLYPSSQGLNQDDRAYELFILLGAKPIKDSRTCFEINSLEKFHEAVSELERRNPDACFIGHLRYDIVDDKLLVYRMAQGPFHGSVVCQITFAIIRYIKELMKHFDVGSDTYRVLAEIQGLTAGVVLSRNGYSNPNILLNSTNQTYSPIIIEIEANRRWGGLDGLARTLHRHIGHFSGDVNMAIGLEAFKGTSRLSVWVPKIISKHKIERDILVNRHFITENDNGSLDIFVKDFVSSSSRKRFPLLDVTAKISIPYTEIAAVVQSCWEDFKEKKASHEQAKRRPDQYEMEEYYPPPLAPSSCTKSGPEAQLAKPFNGNRTFSTLSTSIRPEIPATKSLAPAIAAKGQLPCGFNPRQRASGNPVVQNIGRCLPWIRRLPK